MSVFVPKETELSRKIRSHVRWQVYSDPIDPESLMPWAQAFFDKYGEEDFRTMLLVVKIQHDPDTDSVILDIPAWIDLPE